ncbi:MAG: phosphoesterase [Nitrospirales bacterium]|nr:MAG: phosphoesterase [Nitrospirales bacterium]
MKTITTIGVISDTHGLVRPEALEALEGSKFIIHAGDVGHLKVLEALREIAPVLVVRGNNDQEGWGQEIPLTEVVEVGSHSLYVLHELAHLDLDPATAKLSAIIYGHSHKPQAEYREGVLFLNPGSAGLRRFRLPVTVAHLYVGRHKLAYDIVDLTA